MRVRHRENNIKKFPKPLAASPLVTTIHFMSVIFHEIEVFVCTYVYID